MVSLKKIGAIATGALFIGATVGMAAAVTVPSDFKASMLADKGVAKAQLVVGKNAPGKVEDTASAEIIKEAVKTKLTYTTPGGDILFEYGKDNLDDKDGDDDFANATTGARIANEVKLSGYDGKYLLFNDTTSSALTGLKYDADGNGKLSDDDDYVLYNKVYVYDALSNAIKLVYEPDFAALGDVKKIRGVKYAWTKNTSSSEIKIAPAKDKTLMNYSSADKDYADPLIGDWRVQYVGDNTSGSLYFYRAGSYEGVVSITQASNDVTSDTPSAFKNSYYLWVDLQADGTLKVKSASKADEMTISDGQTDALGYSKAKIKTDKGTIEFQSDTITLVRDDTVDIPGTYYYIDYSDKEMDIKRKKDVTVASGTKMKKDDPDYKDFLKQTIKAKVTGNDVVITYGKDNLDDKDGDDDFANATTGARIANEVKLSGYDGKYLLFNDTTSSALTGLKYDADGNGKLSDDDDYVLYNKVYVYDALSNAIKLVYEPDFAALGDVKKIRGVKYAWTKNTSSSEIKIAPAKDKTLMNYSSADKDYADPLIGDWRVQYVGDNTSGSLYFYRAGSYEGVVSITQASNDVTSDTPSAFKNSYYLWVDLQADGTLKVKSASKADEMTISDGQTDALGYSKAKIKTDKGTIEFQSDTITLVRDDTVDIPGTYYYIDYSDKEMDIKRKKDVTVASGTKMKKDDPDYKDFLKQTIKMKLTGAGEEKVPVLEIVDEDTASKSMNHVLIGGPVANTLVADLVTAGKSKVDWYTSDGDIEVVSDSPASGFTSIIVAGKNREATKAAADALAAAL